jgi:TorA maturation chaperone TorD
MRLQEYLDRKNITASQFAGQIGRAVSTVTRIARGEATPEPGTLAKIVAATGGAVQPNDLFLGCISLDSDGRPMTGTVRADEIPEEELFRAQVYGLLAQFLRAPPDRRLLDAAALLAGDESDLGTAIATLAAVAGETPAASASDEYHALFIGLGRGELLPYGSYYLTGFLNEKPLAVLRTDLARLGVARCDSVREPEDHIGALCEVMAGLITGRFEAREGLATQRQFYTTHLAPWAPHFFADLEKAAAARLYRPIGRIGRLFMAIEEVAFGMEQ